MGKPRKDPMLQAREWIQKNPTAWRYIETFADDRYRRGITCGMKAIMERVRWELAGVDRGSSPYRVDNRIISALARLLVEKRPELAEVIELRPCSLDGLQRIA